MTSTAKRHFDCKKFIEMIRINPCLWSADTPLYRNKEYVTSVWSEIAKEMNETDYYCRVKWHTLRSNYKRECRKKQIENVNGNESRVTWKYYDSLRFLGTYSRTYQKNSNKRRNSSRRTCSVISSTADQNINLSQGLFPNICTIIPMAGSSSSATFEITDFLPSTPTISNQVVKIEKDDQYDIEQPPISPEIAEMDHKKFEERISLESEATDGPSRCSTMILDSGNPYRNDTRHLKQTDYQNGLTLTSNPESDDDTHFLLSLRTAMKNLPSVDNLRFRIGVQQMLLKMVMHSNTQFQ